MESLIADRVKLPELQSNIWSEFAKLATEHDSVNLGQGFPTFSPPNNVTQGLAKATLESNWMNQYTRDYGKRDLVETLAKFYSPLLNRGDVACVIALADC